MGGAQPTGHHVVNPEGVTQPQGSQNCGEAAGAGENLDGEKG